jgi:hypothetical protein
MSVHPRLSIEWDFDARLPEVLPEVGPDVSGCIESIFPSCLQSLYMSRGENMMYWDFTTSSFDISPW